MKGLNRQRGASLLEYMFLVALIAVAVITTVYLIGERLDDMYENIRACVVEPESCEPL